MTSHLATAAWDHQVFKHQEVVLPFAAHRSGDREEEIPLVLFLHGAGERGDDNKAQLKHGVSELLSWSEKTKQPCHIIAPQCPSDVWWVETLNYKSPENLRFAPDQPILAALLALVEKTAREHRIDRKRIYLTGLSMGAYGTFALLAQSPDLWAAALPVCGGGETATVKKFKEMPLHIVHGSEDKVVPVAMSRHLVQALRNAGASHLQYSEMIMTDHDSWTMTYRNPMFWDWMFAQHRK